MTKVTKTSNRGKSPTPTKQDQSDTETGKSDSTRPILTTSNESKKMKLEEEAQQYRQKKRAPRKPKPMTSRIYLAGQAMSALIVKSQGTLRMSEVRREAYDWADFMLDDEY